MSTGESNFRALTERLNCVYGRIVVSNIILRLYASFYILTLLINPLLLYGRACEAYTPCKQQLLISGMQ